MIIGISGKIGSGKDTVGKIIQYLINEAHILNSNEIRYSATFEQFCDPSYSRLIGHVDWQIKRFAGKVKEICSILTGIPVTDFEKQEVKDRVLGEEWNKYKFICNHCGTWDSSTSRSEFTFEHKYCRRCNIGEFEDTTITLTVRQLLQQVATDAMRNVVHPNIWVNALFADYNSLGKSINYMDKSSELYGIEQEVYPNWIITDTRFPNEAEAIKSRGGLLIRVTRKSKRWIDLDTMNEEFKRKGSILYNPNFRRDSLEADTWARLQLNEKYGKETSEYPTEVSIKDDSHLYENGFLLPQYADEFLALKNSWKPVKQGEHSSETSLDNYQFDEVIDNNGTIEELIEKVKQILIKHKII